METRNKSTRYIVMDSTANTGRIYIGEDKSNCSLVENAVTFDSREEAEQWIGKDALDEWAWIAEISEEE